jgi:DNA-binding transcriptional ArsR family regulator
MKMPTSLDHTFNALADPTRRAILGALSRKPEMSVSEIAAPFDISLPAVSKHLDVLEQAGLLRRSRAGRSIFCRLEPKPMEAAMRWLSEYERFWTANLEALAQYLEEEPWTPPSKTSRSPSSGPSKPRPKKSSKPGSTRRN